MLMDEEIRTWSNQDQTQGTSQTSIALQLDIPVSGTEASGWLVPTNPDIGSRDSGCEPFRVVISFAAKSAYSFWQQAILFGLKFTPQEKE